MSNWYYNNQPKKICFSLNKNNFFSKKKEQRFLFYNFPLKNIKKITKYINHNILKRESIESDRLIIKYIIIIILPRKILKDP